MAQAIGQALTRQGHTPAPHGEFMFMPEPVVRGSTASTPGDRGRP